jgi:hypothetical protein
VTAFAGSGAQGPADWDPVAYAVKYALGGD